MIFQVLRSQLRSHRRHTLDLAVIAFLWQASTGVFLLSLVQQYLPRQLEASPAFPGYALAIYAGARFLLQAPAGWLADRIGRQRTLTLGIALSLPSIFLMLQVQDPTSFLAFSALYGIGSAAIWPSIMAYVGDTHEPSARGRTLTMLNVAQLLGLGAGTMAGITLTDLISYQAAFAVCLAFSALGLAFAYRGARAGDAAQLAAPRRGPTTRDIRRKLLSGRMLLLTGIALLLSIATTVQAPVVGAYASEVLKTNMSILGLMLLGPAAVALYILVRFRHVADRFGRQLPLIAGLATAAVCYYALSETSQPVVAVHLVVLAGLAYAVSVPAWGAAALDATEFGSRGLIIGVLATVQGLGGVLGQAVGGVTSAAWGPVAPFRMGAILLGLAVLLTIMQLRQQRRAEAALLLAAG